MFSVLGALLIISPIIIKFPVIHNLISYLLSALGNYKSDYLSLVGGMIGAGLAVSSAIWVQSNSEKKKEKYNIRIQKENQSIKAKILKNLIIRELKMLWGLWIWLRYDSIYFKDKKINFEPYTVNLNHIIEYFIDIESNLTLESINLFYELYYFFEKLNKYIEHYNEMDYAVINLQSDSCLPNQISLRTDYETNPKLHSIHRTIQNLVEEKKYALFFEEKVDFDTWEEYYSIISKKQNEVSNAKEKLIELLKKDSKYVSEEKSNYHELSSIVSKWIDLNTDIELPEKYFKEVAEIINIENEIENMKELYVSIKGSYSKRLDEPYYSENVRKLLSEYDKLIIK